jgi:hypothetical protein
VTRRDPRAVVLCAHWLREGTFDEQQSAALRYALERLTGLPPRSDREWAGWYYDGPGEALYPEPDFAAWREEWLAEWPPRG